MCRMNSCILDLKNSRKPNELALYFYSARKVKANAAGLSQKVGEGGVICVSVPIFDGGLVRKVSF